jgi:hypothetical protein
MIKLNPIGANQRELQIGDTMILFSYKTPVAAWVSGRGWLRTDTKYSKTTTKHINSWLGGVGTVVPQTDIDTLLQGNNITL